MNQENNGKIVSNESTTSPNMLAGSPGIVIAPVNNEPTDASTTNKGQVLTTSSVLNQEPQNISVNTDNINNSTTNTTTNYTENENSTDNNLPEYGNYPPKKKSHAAGLFIFLLLLIIAALAYYIYTDYQKDKNIKQCSPLVASDETLRKLDINSSIVQELYDKIKTSIREDVAYHKFDDNFKLYLAYRQIPNTDIYDSNCNLFNETSMTNFVCSKATNFIPKAFKEETLNREVKKLFGESITIQNQNIVLGNSCYGGYQFIAERGEYVQGYCGQIPTTSYSVDKELISATVQKDTIILKERVRYYSAEEITNEELQSGIYVHTFKLDNHYHYAYISRTIEGA